jgi:anion-transporting  ArsA/GET3 family ATPase
VDPLQFLTTARLVVVAGKGGVGKTTVTAILARAAAARGLRVLAVELDGKPVLQALLGGYDDAHGTHSAIECVTVTPTEALAEYLDAHGLKRVSKRLTSSGIIDVVATAAPGIDDIVVLGKLKQLERNETYDLVLVDGPAAGHAITMLLAPSAMLAAVRGGPIRTQATEVAEMLADPARCQVVLVTLPETTPVNEAIETAYALEERVGVQLGPVVVNAVDLADPLPVDAAPEGSALRAAAVFRNARRALHRAEVTRLSEDLALPQVHVPLVPASDLDASAVACVAAGLSAS